MQRMREGSVPLKMLKGHPDVARRAGRPRGRWEETIVSKVCKSKRLEIVGAE